MRLNTITVRLTRKLLETCVTYDTVIGWWLSWRKNNRIPFCCGKKLMKDSFPSKDVVGGGDIDLLQLGDQSRDGQDLRRKSIPTVFSAPDDLLDNVGSETDKIYTKRWERRYRSSCGLGQWIEDSQMEVGISVKGKNTILEQYQTFHGERIAVDDDGVEVHVAKAHSTTSGRRIELGEHV